MAAKNQGNGGEMQYGDDDASRKRLRKENGVGYRLNSLQQSILILKLITFSIES
jgi:hypothetical protein